MDLLQNSVSWYTCSFDFSNSASKMLNSEENHMVSFSITSSAIFVSSSDHIRALCSNFHNLIVDWSKFSKHCTLIGYVEPLWELPLVTKVDNTGAATGAVTGAVNKDMATNNCGVVIISFALLFIFPTNALDNGLAITPPSK